MRLRGALFLVAFGACYDAPTGDAPCSITCVTECPGDQTCKNGFCVTGDEACAPGFVTISTGAGFACALDEIHDAWCWGVNDHHQVDPGDQRSIPLAHKIEGRRYDMLSAGRAHVCAISGGKIFCWGANDFGQISGSISDPDVSSPTEIQVTGGPASWRFVSAGFSTTCAIADDGRLFCWGTNNSGELGNGTKVASGVPIPVKTTLADWTSVTSNGLTAGGVQHTCAISASTGLWCWGSNAYGQIALDASVAESLEPVNVPVTAPTSVATAAYATCATTAAGELLCWGYSQFNQLGDPSVVVPSANYYAPQLATTIGEWASVSMGEVVACGVRTNGEVWCWGLTRTGAGLAGGVWAPGPAPALRLVSGGATQVSVGFNVYLDPDGAAGYDLETTCFVGAGAVRCWGDNRFGQLGQGTTSESPVPLEIAGARTWSTIATGMRHSCGIADGELSCWGSTLRGAVNGVVAGTAAKPCGEMQNGCDPAEPRAIGPATGLAIGLDHTCSLDGTTVACWGDDTWVQLGTIGLMDTSPTEVTGAWDSIIDLHGVSTCARAGGETSCWGNNQEPSVVVELASMTSISMGGVIVPGYTGVACFLDGTNQMFCSGDNSIGQFGNGPTPAVCDDGVCGPGDCEAQCLECVAGCLSCGNGACDNGENTTTCGVDCGAGFANLRRSYLAVSVGWDPLGYSGQLICGVTMGGTVDCWGNNPGAMILPDIDPNTGLPFTVLRTPQPIAGLAACTEISVGYDHACALCGGEISCWGNHSHGAVGSGPLQISTVRTPRAVDVVLDPGDSWAQLTSGIGFSCARSANGRGVCWGSNPHGALGIGGTASTLPLLVRAE